MSKLSLSALVLTLMGCMSNSYRLKTDTGTETRPEAPSEVQAEASVPFETATDLSIMPAELPKNTPAPSPPTPEPPMPTADAEDCLALKDDISLPHFLGEQPVLILQFLKTCEAKDGKPGFRVASPWTALGVPCTGGAGRIDKRGHEMSSPSVVRFQTSINCPMAPAQTSELEHIVQKAWQLPTANKLVAFFPLAIEYWEFEGIKDSGLGGFPTLTSAEGLGRWQKWVNQKVGEFPVRFYGRENAWNQSQSVYEVAALIIPLNRSQFRVQVQKIRRLDVELTKEVLARCKAAGGRSGCDEIFNIQ